MMVELADEYWPFDRIWTRRTGFYMPVRDGVDLTLVPVQDAGGEVIDCVAYSLTDPTRWWLRTGLGCALGEFAIQFARDYRVPIHLCATPHQWLRCRVPLSCCVLQPARARAVLADIDVIREDRRDGG